MVAVRALLLLALLASPAAGEEGRYLGDLAAAFVPVGELEGTWEVLQEAPVDPDRDPALRGRGVRAVRTQHYTRYRGPISQVCSVEIWAFVSVARAESVARRLHQPGWRILRQGDLLIMLRARTLERRVGTTRTIFADCARIGKLTSARVASLR